MSNNTSHEYDDITRSKPVQSSYDSYTGRYKILNPKQRLLNMVCACLIKEPSFFDDLVFEMPSRHWQANNSAFIWMVKFVMDFNDCTKHELLDLVFKVSRRDPEYVLKLAFYVRNDLGIRSTANFLLAAASACPEARSAFLRYYHKVIRLPSDWLEVCSYYVVIRRHLLRSWMAYHPNQNKILKTVLSVKEKAKIQQLLHEFKFEVVPGRDLPKILQQAMREKFLDFDVYQLGKYNKENSIKRKFLKKTYNERKKAGRSTGDNSNSFVARGGFRGSFRGRRMPMGRRRAVGRPRSGRVTLQPGDNDETINSTKDFEDAYNSEDSEEAINSDNDDSDIEEKQTSLKKIEKKRKPTTGESSKKPQFTMKKMVRMLHISEPKEYVLGLLGKKYPNSEQEFLGLGLNKPPLSRSRRSKNEPERVFDLSMSGTRMKLPIPETWETELSAKGNLASTWEGLLDSGKLPFMAMLRNLRNLISTGISPMHHQIVLDKLCDANTIKHSNQFPFRFFSAYQAIDVDLKKLKKLKKGSEEYVRKQEAKIGKKMLIPEHLPDAELIEKYRFALDQAVQLAVTNNIKEVKGNSVVMVDVSDSMKTSVCSSAKAGNFTSSIEIGVLLGLMCHFVCQKSDFLIYSSPSLIWPEANYQNMTQGLKDEKILSNMKTVLQRASQMGAVRQFPISYFEQLIEKRIFVDQAIVISDMEWDDRNIRSDSTLINSTINRYRKIVNPNFLFICIDLFGSGGSLVNMNEGEKDPRNISITGFSDQILRFVAEKSDDAQLRYVQNIDKVKKVELPELLVSEHKPPSKKNRRTKHTKSKRASLSQTSASLVKNEIIIIREDSSTFQPNIQDKNIVQVISKAAHCFLLTDDGSVYGLGKAGSMFSKNTEEATLIFSSEMLKLQSKSSLLKKDSRVEYVTYISCGNEHLVALTNMGNVFAMGSNSDNQLGMTTETDHLSEMKQVFAGLEIFPKIVKISCGSFYTLFLDSNGVLYGCGRNTHHQLGTISVDGPATKLYQSPRRIELKKEMGKIVEISAGGSHTALIDSNGSIWMMGNNSHGQCGVGTVYNSIFNPVKVTMFNGEKNIDIKIESVSCGEYHTAILTTERQMYVFGNGINGQLGINSVSDNESSPYLVLSYQKNFVYSVECSKFYTIALTKTGRLYTCGNNPNSNSSNEEQIMLPTLAPSLGSRRVLHASYGDEYKVIVAESRSLLSRSMLEMVNDEQFFDMILKVRAGESIVDLHLHKLILDGRCPFLLSNLCARVHDPNTPVCYEMKLEGVCQGVAIKSVVALIEYIYTGEVNFYHLISQAPEFELTCKSDWDNLKKLAFIVQLESLEKLCVNYHPDLSRDQLMINAMESIYANKEHTSDCRLNINNGHSLSTIHCHSAIIACRSEYFKSLLVFDRAEKGTIGTSQFGFTTMLTLDDVDDPRGVEAILFYLYTGTIKESLVHAENALDILRLAHKFCLAELREELENMIIQYINVSNVSVILECADFYEWDILKQFLIHFIIRDHNTEAVYEQNSFKELKRNNVLLTDEIKRLKKQETKRRQSHHKQAVLLS